MTPTEFQNNHSGDLKNFLDTPMGRELFSVLNSLKPSYEFPIHEHLLIANREAIRGYELCLKHMLALAIPAKIVSQPEANYGVPDKKTTE